MPGLPASRGGRERRLRIDFRKLQKKKLDILENYFYKISKKRKLFLFKKRQLKNSPVRPREAPPLKKVRRDGSG
jgi:hypothetical protein